jgi:hypothetical protein
MTASASRTAQNVFKRHAEAMIGGDLDDIVNDYAHDALFITQAGVLNTATQSRAVDGVETLLVRDGQIVLQTGTTRRSQREPGHQDDDKAHPLPTSTNGPAEIDRDTAPFEHRRRGSRDLEPERAICTARHMEYARANSTDRHGMRRPRPTAWTGVRDG